MIIRYTFFVCTHPHHITAIGIQHIDCARLQPTIATAFFVWCHRNERSSLFIPHINTILVFSYPNASFTILSNRFHYCIPPGQSSVPIVHPSPCSQVIHPYASSRIYPQPVFRILKQGELLGTSTRNAIHQIAILPSDVHAIFIDAIYFAIIKQQNHLIAMLSHSAKSATGQCVFGHHQVLRFAAFSMIVVATIPVLVEPIIAFAIHIHIVRLVGDACFFVIRVWVAHKSFHLQVVQYELSTCTHPQIFVFVLNNKIYVIVWNRKRIVLLIAKHMEVMTIVARQSRCCTYPHKSLRIFYDGGNAVVWQSIFHFYVFEHEFLSPYRCERQEKYEKGKEVSFHKVRLY